MALLQASVSEQARLGASFRKVLLDKQFDPGKVDTDGRGYVHTFVLAGDYALLDAVLRQGCPTNQPDQKGVTPLHLACTQNDFVAVKKLCDYKADANARGDFGRTPLHLAAIWGSAPACRELLRNQADPLAQDQDGNTPLHYACYTDKVKACAVLLTFGQPQCAVLNQRGETAEDIARSRKLEGILEQLAALASGAPPPALATLQHGAAHTAAASTSSPRHMVVWSYATPGHHQVLEDKACLQLEKAYRLFKEAGKPTSGPLATTVVCQEGSFWQCSLATYEAKTLGLVPQTTVLKRSRVPCPPQQTAAPARAADNVSVSSKAALFSGAGGVVFKGRMGQQQQPVAVKAQKGLDQQALLREVRLLSQLDSPYVVRCFGVTQWCKTSCAVTELAECSLSTFVATKRGLSGLLKRALVLDVCRGMQHLGARGVVHSNLSTNSVLVFKCPTRGVRCKIAGFHWAASSPRQQPQPGGAALAPSPSPSPAADATGKAAAFAAPEVLGGHEPTAAADMFSAGVLVWAVFHARFPHAGRSGFQIKCGTQNGERPPVDNACLPADIRELMQQAWHQDALERPTFAQAAARLDLVRDRTLALPPSRELRLDPADNATVHLVAPDGAPVKFDTAQRAEQRLAAPPDHPAGSCRWVVDADRAVCYTTQAAPATMVAVFDLRRFAQLAACTSPGPALRRLCLGRSSTEPAGGPGVTAWFQDSEGRIGCLDVARGTRAPTDASMALDDGCALCPVGALGCVAVGSAKAVLCSPPGTASRTLVGRAGAGAPNFGPCQRAAASPCTTRVASLHPAGCALWGLAPDAGPAVWVPLAYGPTACCFSPLDSLVLAVCTGDQVTLLSACTDNRGQGQGSRVLRHVESPKAVAAACFSARGDLLVMDNAGHTQVWQSIR